MLPSYRWIPPFVIAFSANKLSRGCHTDGVEPIAAQYFWCWLSCSAEDSSPRGSRLILQEQASSGQLRQSTQTQKGVAGWTGWLEQVLQPQNQWYNTWRRLDHWAMGSSLQLPPSLNRWPSNNHQDWAIQESNHEAWSRRKSLCRLDSHSHLDWHSPILLYNS